MLHRLAPLAMLVLLLNACATRPPAPESAPEGVWEQHRDSLRTLTDWQLAGRVAIRNAEEGWSANFDWWQTGQRYRIRLRGPFGQGAVELHGDAQGVWLKRKDQAPVYAHDADALLARETGWQLPVSGLGAWLRGLPDTTPPVTSLDWDSAGQLTQLQQSGWQIDYRRYRTVGERQLPDKLQLVRDGLRVKVVVDSWQTP